MKKIAFYFLTMICCCYLFVNCEQEEINIKQKTTSEGFLIKKIPRQKIIENQKVKLLIDKFNRNKTLVKPKNNKQKTINNLSIDIESVKYIEKGSYHSYTFAIVNNDSDKEDKIKNLLLNLNNKGEYDTYLVTYSFTENQMSKMSFEDFTKAKVKYKPINFDYEGLLVNLKKSQVICVEYQKRVSVPCCKGELCHATSKHCIVNGGTGQYYEWITVSSKCTVVNNNSGSNNDSSIENDEESSTSGGASGEVIITAPNTIPHTSKLKNFISSTLNANERNYYNSIKDVKNTINRYLIDCNFSSRAKLKAKNDLELANKLNLNFQEFNWVSKNYNSNIIKEIKLFLTENSWSQQAKQWAHAQITLHSIKIKWKAKSGLVANRANLKHTHASTIGHRSFFKLTDGSVVMGTNTSLNLGNESAFESSETADDLYWYIKPADTKEWSVFILPKVPSLAKEIEMLMKVGLFEVGKAIGTYVLPVDDLKIIITGKDLNGQDANRFMATGFLVTSVVPGSKFLKAGKVVSIIAKTEKTWAKVIKWGDKSYKLTYKVINNVVDFGDRGQLARILKTSSNIEAHHIIPWKKCTNAVVQAAARVGFHPNMVQNGIGLQKYSRLIGSGLHGNHPAYDNFVLHRLNTFQRNGFSPESANAFLVNNLIPELKNLIIKAKNSNMNLNEYFKKVANPANGIPNY